MEEIKNISDLLVIASNSFFIEQRGRWIFRGHADAKWALMPSLGRESHTSSSIEKYEKSILIIFRREALGYLEPVPNLPKWELKEFISINTSRAAIKTSQGLIIYFYFQEILLIIIDLTAVWTYLPGNYQVRRLK